MRIYDCRTEVLAILFFLAILIGAKAVYSLNERARQVEGLLFLNDLQSNCFELIANEGTIGFQVNEKTKYEVVAPNFNQEVKSLEDLSHNIFTIVVRYGTSIPAPAGVFKAKEWYHATKITVTDMR